MEDHPGGNIIKGFDGYVKYASGSGSNRRKGGSVDSDRLFSRSSVGGFYANGGDESASGSQAGSGRSTPLRINVGGNGGGGGGTLQTPTTAGSQLHSTGLREASGLGAASNGSAGLGKKIGHKRSATVGEDSETDNGDRKRIRTNFGAVGAGGGRK